MEITLLGRKNGVGHIVRVNNALAKLFKRLLVLKEANINKWQRKYELKPSRVIILVSVFKNWPCFCFYHFYVHMLTAMLIYTQ